jgi:Fic family protein
VAQNVYLPAFNRYPAAVMQAFGRIERARGVIESAPILPAQEEILRQDARVGSIHYSNLIEGNELPRVEALRAVKHELDPTDRAKLELVNYVAALEFIERAHREGTITYSPEFLLHLHGVLTRGLGREGARFLPHHEGAWRDGDIVVADAIHVYHEGPPAEEVPNLMAERLRWLEGKRLSDEYPGPILAGVGHFEINEIHPFADYNGRAARLFAVAVLYREGFMSRRLFSPERYYAEDKDAYYQALRAIKRTRNLNDWLSYYVNGLASEFERVAERVVELSRLTRSLPLPLQLTESQEKAVAALTVEGLRALTIPEYVELTGVSPRTASRELNALAEAGVLRARGTTRDRRFVLPVARRPSGGRPPTWTDERIRRSLANLVEELGRWPAYRDFEAMSLLPLYAAIQRTGGEARWRPAVQPPISSYKN